MLRAACAVLAWMGALYGQSDAPRFEVASIKPVSEPSDHSGAHSNHGHVTAENITLKGCIMRAYSVGPQQVAGGPDWLNVDRFDIDAKAEQPTEDDRLMNAMLGTLLGERFKLAFHRETRPIEAFLLEVAKNGPKLEKAPGGNSVTHTSSGDRRVTITATNTGMDSLARLLSGRVDLPVINRTGLDGVYNVKLEWTPETTRPEPDTGPSLFTAIQEQIGLRLRAGRTPVEVLVIDHAEKPGGN